jgi:hypothetical protein
LIVDTQIISYCYSGHWQKSEARKAEISSVTASEFLLFHTREDNNVDYYVINPNRYGTRHSLDLVKAYSEHAKNNKWAKMGARRTDSVIIDFSKDYQPYRMFGNEAIASIINDKHLDAFKLSILHLDKGIQKKLKNKMEFILDNNMICHRLNDAICDVGMTLLVSFQKHLTPKANIKNTVNDILILSTAINREKTLLTEDKVLGKFAASEFSAKFVEKEESMIVDFSSPQETKTKLSRESKGYINRGWAYSFTKGNL